MNTRRGVILVEVLVALAIGGVVIAGSVSALRTIVQSERALEKSHRAFSTRRNDLRRLQSIASFAVAGQQGIGTDTSFAFASFCELPEGWRAACDVQIRRPAGPLRSLVMSLSVDDSIRIGGGGTEIRYLVSASNGGAWQRAWYDSDRLPIGMAFIDNADTLFVRFQHAYDAAN